VLVLHRELQQVVQQSGKNILVMVALLGGEAWLVISHWLAGLALMERCDACG
jgi:hypothetical protein